MKTNWNEISRELIYELRIIMNLSEENIRKQSKDLKIGYLDLKNFYLATGRFPEIKEDEFICEHGFTNWYNAYNSPIFNKQR